MSENNLVQNGDFSGGNAYWILEGLAHNAQVITESGDTFMRFGPSVTMYQDIVVTPSCKHDLAFRFQALYMGNGIVVKVIELDADNRPAQTLVEQEFGQTQGWTNPTITVPGSTCVKLRVQFEIFSAADLDDVALRADLQQLRDPGLVGGYYNGTSFESLIFQRIDPVIDFDWPVGHPPSNDNISLNRNNFSIRWSGYLHVPRTVTKRVIFRTISDDGLQLWVYPLNTPKPNPIVNNWTLHPPTVDDSNPCTLAADTIYHLQLDYFQGPEPGVVRLHYYFEGDPPESAQVVPAEWLYSALG